MKKLIAILVLLPFILFGQSTFVTNFGDLPSLWKNSTYETIDYGDAVSGADSALFGIFRTTTTGGRWYLHLIDLDGTTLWKVDSTGAHFISEYIYHQGDADTYFRFFDDSIHVNAGGTNFLRIIEGASDFIQAGATLALGSNSLTMTGSIASTGSRVAKGWFTDLEVTNDITISGTALAATYQSLHAALTSISGLSEVDVSILETTADNAYNVVTSGGNNYILGSNSGNTALEFKAPTGSGSPVLATSPTITTPLINTSITLGDSATGDNDYYFYFSTDGSYTTEYFKWDDGNTEYMLSDDIDINGAVDADKYISAVTNVTSSSDAIDVSGVSIVKAITYGGHITIGGFSGGETGQIIFLISLDANGVTIENDEATGTQKILTATNADMVITNQGGFVFAFDGTYWRMISEIDPTLIALSGLSTAANQIIYATGSDAFSMLSVNSTATNKFLRQVSSGAPSWQTLVAGDIPDISGTSGAIGATLVSLAGLTETNGGIPYGTADNAYTWLAAGAEGTLLMGNGAGAPSWLGAGTSGYMLVAAGAADPVWTAPTGTGSPVKATAPTFEQSINITDADSINIGNDNDAVIMHDEGVRAKVVGRWNDLEGYINSMTGVYGVWWNDSTDTYGRIGTTRNIATGQALTNNQAPIHAKMRRCIVDDSGVIQYYLDASDSRERQDLNTSATGDTGVADTDTGSKLVDTGKFTLGELAYQWKFAYNSTDGLYSTITGKDSDDQLALAADAFPDGDEDWEIVTKISGTDDAGTASKLSDTGIFIDAESYYKGRYVHNTTDDTYSLIVGKDDNNTLSIADDIMDNGESYEILSAVLNGDDGQVMVEIPKFWVKYCKIGNKHYWIVAEAEMDGFQPHPAFYKNGEWVPRRFIGAYQAVRYDDGTSAYVDGDGTSNADAANDILGSISGYIPDTNETRDEYRDMAANRGTGWRQYDFWLYQAVAMLYITEYADFDSQTMISAGNTKFASFVFATCVGATGKSNGDGNGSGGQSTTNGNIGDYVTYRGIEDIFGTIWQFLDGFNIHNSNTNGSRAFVSNNDADFSDDADTGYDYIASLALTDGYIKGIADNIAILPDNCSGGSSSTFLTDYFNSYYDNENDVGWRVVRVGGIASTDVAAGVLCVASTSASSYDGSDIGARLCF